MKKYLYEVIDTGEKILAESGEEFDREWSKTHKERPEGAIKLTNLETGEEAMMYPFKIN